MNIIEVNAFMCDGAKHKRFFSALRDSKQKHFGVELAFGY
jgi:hypothetical protein